MLSIRNLDNNKVWLTGLFVAAVFFAAPLFVIRPDEKEPDIRVAFIGNSITFVNDLPRLMEAISNQRITQNSCLHGGSRFGTILRIGNGMGNKWTTDNALLEENFRGYPMYDFGACSVPQLLFGYDENLSEDNDNGYYKDDGKNPCFHYPYYLEYLNQKYYATTSSSQSSQPQPPRWDYVVMNDQTQSPVHKREASLEALEETYADYFARTGSVPVFLVTHGYWTDDRNMTGLGGDVAAFSSRLYHGYQQYAALLRDLLPAEQEPLMAPVGLAYLLVWEENYRFWEKLFFTDGYHPSPHGTYLSANVLYATLYGKMPSIDTLSFNNNNDGGGGGYVDGDDDDPIAALWSKARKMHIGNTTTFMPHPTRDEAIYLRWIAERVTLRGYRPRSFIDYTGITYNTDDDYYNDDFLRDDDDDYDDDYHQYIDDDDNDVDDDDYNDDNDDNE